MLSGQSQLAILCKEYISGKLTKNFSQFRLHFRLCLGSFVGWCSSRAYFHKLYDAVLRSHMKLHLASPLPGHLLHCHFCAAPLVMVLPHAHPAAQPIM